MGLLNITKLIGRADIPEDVKKDILDFRKTLEEKDREIVRHKKSTEELLAQISAGNRRQEALSHKLQHNPVSGLPNHSVLERDLGVLLDKRGKPGDGRPFAVAMLQFNDNFGLIKKTLDPSINEWVIYESSERLKNVLPEGTWIYHSREDEFSFILHDVGSENELSGILHKVYAVITKSHRFPGKNFSLGGSIGAVLYPGNARTKTLLLRDADIALEYAKRNGKDFVIFRDEMSEKVIEKMELQNAIIKALEQQAIAEIKKQFELYFQPILSLVMIEGRIRSVPWGAEALIRWHHPTKGLINPGKFIPVAEETGLIIPIGNWVLYEAVSHLVQWQAEGYENYTIAINLSPRQFKSESLVENVERVIAKNGVNPKCLEVEITESSVMDDPKAAIRKIQQLRGRGIKIAIDDFGTGYSSLSYLKDLPIDAIKIDKTFVDSIADDTNNQNIVHALISMAHRLGIDVVAEGIESPEQLKTLFKLGCRRIQGYYYHTPLSGKDFADYLRDTMRPKVGDEEPNG